MSGADGVPGGCFFLGDRLIGPFELSVRALVCVYPRVHPSVFLTV